MTPGASLDLVSEAPHSQSHCPLCGGSKQPGKTTYTVDFGTSIIIIRNVPAMVCDQCGEEWIGAATAGKLEQLTHDARQRGEQVAIIAM
jgi:YgiT-type zinc finger domain-containing protein